MHHFIQRQLVCSRQPILQSCRSTQQPQLSLSRTTILSTRSKSTASPRSVTKLSSLPRFSQPPTPPPSKTEAELLSLGYIVRRTPSVQLPIYKKRMGGGTKQVVMIKKIDGDRRKLLSELSEALSVDKGNIRINPTTQHIELKGDYFDSAKGWLIERGF